MFTPCGASAAPSGPRWVERVSDLPGAGVPPVPSASIRSAPSASASASASPCRPRLPNLWSTWIAPRRPPTQSPRSSLFRRSIAAPARNDSPRRTHDEATGNVPCVAMTTPRSLRSARRDREVISTSPRESPWQLSSASATSSDARRYRCLAATSSRSYHLGSFPDRRPPLPGGRRRPVVSTGHPPSLLQHFARAMGRIPDAGGQSGSSSDCRTTLAIRCTAMNDVSGRRDGSSASRPMHASADSRMRTRVFKASRSRRRSAMWSLRQDAS